MKKLISILLAVVMLLSFAACGDKTGPLTASVLPSDELTSLNAIAKAGFKTVHIQSIDNVYAQTVENSKGEQFVAVVKVLPEQLEAFYEVDYFDENAAEKYLEVIGDNIIEDILPISEEMPDLDDYLSQFFDVPEKVYPQEMGESKSNLDEINAAVGCSIKAVTGASEEKFSVIDGKIAQYIYVLDDMYYCVRSSADTNINLADDQFGDDPIVDENGYVTLAGATTDATNSIRFVFNDYQYAFIIYDNGEFDWSKVNVLEDEYRSLICTYPAGSVFDGLVGQYTAEDNYSMSITPVSDKSVQATIFTYTQTDTETEQKLWTMIVKANGSKLAYDKSRLEVYKNNEQTSKEAGKGSMTVKDGTIVWDKRTFTKVQ